MIFEIINMSDAYTMESDEFHAACVAAIILGEGAYGLDEVDGPLEMPIFLLGGHDKWFNEMFGMDVEKSLELMGKSEAVGLALKSVVIGSAAARRSFLKMRDMIEPDKVDEFEAEWLDSRRSSMNNIGARAKELANLILGEPKAV